MKIHTKFLGAVAVACTLISAPMFAGTASAVSTPLDDANLTDGLSGATGTFNNIDDSFSFDQGFRSYDAGDTAILTFVNNTSGSIRLIAGQDATLNPVNAFQPGGVFFGFTGQTPEGLHLSTIAQVLGAGESTDLTISVVTGTGELLGSIDVLVTAETVPLPAPILLFGSALAGLGFLSRKRKQSAIA